MAVAQLGNHADRLAPRRSVVYARAAGAASPTAAAATATGRQRRLDGGVGGNGGGARGDHRELVAVCEAWVDAKHGRAAQRGREQQRRKVGGETLDRLAPRRLERAPLDLARKRWLEQPAPRLRGRALCQGKAQAVSAAWPCAVGAEGRACACDSGGDGSLVAGRDGEPEQLELDAAVHRQPRVRRDRAEGPLKVRVVAKILAAAGHRRCGCRARLLGARGAGAAAPASRQLARDCCAFHQRASAQRAARSLAHRGRTSGHLG
mmetsp:Transcript_7243/g.23210  ORF Transcript_7243/g.23210 Transcript_7243/m.23210 type:complete len:263 (-) Transcript_7243:659-1447(-)